MGQQQKLSKSRLHLILALYECPVTMTVEGGWDTGVYFSFHGRMKCEYDPNNRIVGGRIVRPSGFCSEGMTLTHAEQHSRLGSAVRLGWFWDRVQTRRQILQRWLDGFYL